MNRVDIKLASQPRFGLVLSEAEHADTGNQHDRGIRIAHGRGIGPRIGLVVFRIFLAIILQRRIDLLAKSLPHPSGFQGTNSGRILVRMK